jgi:thiaminase
MGFVQGLHTKYEKDWNKMLAHPFLAETANGTIPDERFANWVAQDYLFVREAVPFIAMMIPKAPLAHRTTLAGTVSAFQGELSVFEQMAAEHGIRLEGVEPAPINLAYINWLRTTALLDPYEAAYTALYAGEKAYTDSWMVVKQGLKGPSKWQAFIDVWTNEGFAAWVDSLATDLDVMAEGASERMRALMERRFVDGLRYEYQFWNLAYYGESWGIAE